MIYLPLYLRCFMKDHYIFYIFPENRWYVLATKLEYPLDTFFSVMAANITGLDADFHPTTPEETWRRLESRITELYPKWNDHSLREFALNGAVFEEDYGPTQYENCIYLSETYRTNPFHSFYGAGWWKIETRLEGKFYETFNVPTTRPKRVWALYRVGKKHSHVMGEWFGYGYSGPYDRLPTDNATITALYVEWEFGGNKRGRLYDRRTTYVYETDTKRMKYVCRLLDKERPACKMSVRFHELLTTCNVNPGDYYGPIDNIASRSSPPPDHLLHGNLRKNMEELVDWTYHHI